MDRLNKQTFKQGKRNCCKSQEPAIAVSKSDGCCGGTATNNPNACCVLDEEIKSSGGMGCGCSSKS